MQVLFIVCSGIYMKPKGTMKKQLRTSKRLFITTGFRL